MFSIVLPGFLDHKSELVIPFACHRYMVPNLTEGLIEVCKVQRGCWQTASYRFYSVFPVIEGMPGRAGVLGLVLTVE